MINISSASIAIGNESYSINTDYSVSEILTGWINVSFSDASEDTLIEAFNSSMNLMDFLEANTINCYTSSRCSCFPSDCDGVYSTINVGSGYTSNSYSTDFLDTTLIGIKFSNVNYNTIWNLFNSCCCSVIRSSKCSWSNYGRSICCKKI